MAGVVDLTHSIADDRTNSTLIDAPAHFVRGAWTVDEIPVDRLLAPLVIVDVSKHAEHNPDYQVGMNDLAAWEQANGPVPAGAIVVARTGWAARWYDNSRYRNTDAHGVMHFPGFSEDAVRFLIDARQIVAIGTDTLSVDRGIARDLPVERFTAARQVYRLANIANLDKVPDAGATAVIAPTKLQGGSAGPVRILALLK
ncbi:MAG: cyclase family protein [Acidobacteriaceae bacterium]|nr:cyclase family protein [Acidobacteriaceae bacterium]